VLLGDGDAVGVAVLANQHLDQVGNGAVFAQGGDALMRGSIRRFSVAVLEGLMGRLP
jgi:hypothetical protein